MPFPQGFFCVSISACVSPAPTSTTIAPLAAADDEGAAGFDAPGFAADDGFFDFKLRFTQKSG